MLLLKSPVFIICCILFVFHQVFLLIFDYHIPFFDAYLDNLLAMPIILTLLLVERIYLFKWNNYHRLTGLEVFAATLFVAFISEIIFPLFSEDFAGDWIDVLVFSVGSVIFYFTINNAYKDSYPGH